MSAQPTEQAPIGLHTLAAALDLARRGLYVFPVHTVRDGVCSCSDPGGKGCKPGKHPVTARGHLDATRDPARIRELWRSIPDANVGVALKLSKLVSIAPDNPHWHDVFQRRGLPDTGCYQSGGGEGHLHYLTRSSEDCPPERVCKSGQYDILADGYAIAPPSQHQSGRMYEWITPLTSVDDLAETPTWAVDILKAQAAERETRKQASTSTPQFQTETGPGDADDEPPVVLDDDGMQLWRGERSRETPDGKVDRSGTLFAIARRLRDANATRRTIAAAVAERDRTLGGTWPTGPKYAGRTDEAIRYAEIADKVLSEPRLLHANPVVSSPLENAPAGCPNCRRLADELAEEKRRNTRIIQGLAGKDIDRRQPTDERPQPVPAIERRIYVAAVLDHEHERSNGALREDGKSLARLSRIARYAGCSDATASRYLRKGAEERGLFTIARKRNEATGHTDLFMAPAAENTNVALERIAAIVDPPRTRGGRRIPQCPDHPNAKVIAYKYACSVCGQTLDPLPDDEMATEDDAQPGTQFQTETGPQDQTDDTQLQADGLDSGTTLAPQLAIGPDDEAIDDVGPEAPTQFQTETGLPFGPPPAPGGPVRVGLSGARPRQSQPARTPPLGSWEALFDAPPAPPPDRWKARGGCPHCGGPLAEPWHPVSYAGGRVGSYCAGCGKAVWQREAVPA